MSAPAGDGAGGQRAALWACCPTSAGRYAAGRKGRGAEIEQ